MIARFRSDRSLDWHMLHVNACEDETCAGCKKCRDCGGLTRSCGFEDNRCFNCQHPPSD